MRYVPAYFVAIVVFLILDAIWLGLVARSFYVSRMGDLMADSPRWGFAIVFYALFIVGVIYFAVSAGIANGQWTTAAFNGLLFGFFTYLTYNFTALSVIRGFDPTLAMVDTIWGAVCGALVSGITVMIVNAFGWR